MGLLLGLVVLVVAASTYKPRTGGSTPGGAPAGGAGGIGPRGGIPGGIPGGGRTVPPGNAGLPGNTGVVGPAAGPANGAVMPSGRTYDSSVCFTGIPNVGTDTDLSGLPVETRSMYIDAYTMKPLSGIGNMTRDFIADTIENLGKCIEARGYTVGAQKLYARAAEVRSGVQDGPGGVPYSVIGDAVSTTPGGVTPGYTMGGGVPPSSAPLAQPPLTYTPGGNGMIQQPLGGGRGGVVAVPVFRPPTGPLAGGIPVAAIDPVDAAVAALPDEPPGNGLRSETAKILRLFDSWKAPLTSFPFGDSAWLRARADAIESTYNARRAAARLRTIANAVDEATARAALDDAGSRQEARVSTEWPGIAAITDPTIKNIALGFARAFHKTTEWVAGECEGGFFASGCEPDYSVTVLVPVAGFPTPALGAIQTLLTTMNTLYPSAYADAKRELSAMIQAITAGRVRGSFTD